MRRLFWLSVGAAAGYYAARKSSEAVERVRELADEQDQRGRSHADGQAGDVDERKGLAPHQVAPGDLEVVQMK